MRWGPRAHASHTWMLRSSEADAKRYTQNTGDMRHRWKLSKLWRAVSWCPRARVSHTRMLRSTEADANTVFSLGLHCTSSTDPSWPCHVDTNRLVSLGQHAVHTHLMRAANQPAASYK